MFETLMASSLDESNTEYGLLAESVDVAEDGRSVIFTLRDSARFHDGRRVTAKDVVFSYDMLTTKGRPFYRKYYEDVEGAEALDGRRVRFAIRPDSPRETPLILGQLTVLPAHDWKDRDFSRSTLKPLVGSGPYRIETIEPGRRITFVRDPDHWGRDLPVNRGQYNFDRITWDYFRDQTVALEAFKAGVFDYRRENTAKVWATLYNGSPFDDGRILKEEIPLDLPLGMQAFIFNTRRVVFQDPKVREALSLAFDFEWANRNLFFGQYARTTSYFENSDFAARAPASPEERALLSPFKDRLPESVFGKPPVPPVSDGSGNIRARLRQAAALLDSAGWKIRNGKRVHEKTGKPLSFTLYLRQPGFQRISMPFRKNLARLGVTANIEVASDPTRYIRQIREFDFDMIVGSFRQSDSPGSEQRNMWGSQAASLAGSRNLIGLEDPVVDAIIDHILSAKTRKELVTACRALDRVLLAGHYVIPQWHNRGSRVAFWNKFRRPEVTPSHGMGLFTWWIDTDIEKRLTPEAVMPPVNAEPAP